MTIPHLFRSFFYSVLPLVGVLAACGGGGNHGGGSIPKSWDTPQLLETSDFGDADYPQVAVDTNGNAIVVWEQFDGLRTNIWANRYTAGSGWGTAELLEFNNAGDAFSPQIAVDGDGNALAVWSQYDGAYFSIVARNYQAGLGWGTPFAIEGNSGNAWYAQVRFDAAGNAMVVWQQDDGTRNNIWANRHTAGGTWGVAQLIETGTGGASAPQVALDPVGNAFAVWDQWDGTRSNIWVNRYTNGTGWGVAQLIETGTGTAGSPQIAVDTAGNAIAVWYQWDGARYNIWANNYNPGGGWGVAGLVESDDAGNAGAPQIDVDASSNAIAVWEQFDGTRSNIWANRYTHGSGWGTAELVEINNAGAAIRPSVARHASGSATVVWRQSDGTRYNIWANHYDVGSGWSAASLVETDDAGDAVRPQVSVDASGNAIAVWSQSDGTRYNIWASRYQ